MRDKKGSITAEAVFVIPLCLMAVFALLMAGFCLHHKSWYTMAAQSCVYAGTADKRDRAAAAACWEEIKQKQYFPVSSVSAQVTETGDGLRVKVEGRVSGLWGLKGAAFQAQAERREISPPELLRRIRRLSV